jgi:hypothetical protein
MIKIRIRNADHEIDVQFPISENKLYAKLAEIHAIEGKDAPQSAFVTEVYWPEELSMLKDRIANLDELNYLARRVESFDYHEYDQFLIGITKLENPTEKDLINLTFNLDHFTLCKDVSSYTMPTKYIHFTDEQKEQARRTDLADLLRSQGEALKRSGSEYEWRDGSQKVTIRGNLWFHQYEQKGGDAVDFVRRFYNKSYPEAMVYLLGGASGVLTVSPPIEKKTAEPFVLPEKNDNMRRVYAYLMHHRGVDRDVLYAFAHKGMIYESAEYHNAVFVGYDAQGKVKQVGTKTEQGRYSSKYALTELLICGECGTPYRRCTWAANGKKKVVWRCINRLDYGKKYCHDSPSIEESVLQEAIMKAVLQTAKQNADVLKTLKLHIGMGLSAETTEDNSLDLQIRIAEVEAEFQKMLKAIAADNVEAFDEEKAKALMDEKAKLQIQLDRIADTKQKRENAKSRLDEIFTIIEALANHPISYDDQIVRQVLESVIVESKEKIKVVFVGGLEVTQLM